MRKTLLATLIACAVFSYASAQNVGIGTAAPAQKLHVSDATLPNAATIRVNGLSTTTTLAAGTGPMAVVIVDANGIMYRGATTGAGGVDAWYTLGNAGTVPATNFIGTTDAQDFVTKTAGSAAGNERMRIIGAGATPGNVIVNNTGPFAGDVFSVYANNTTNGTTASIANTIGTFAINGYAAASGTGVYGETNQGASGSGTAVWGNVYGTATAASNTSEAVWGTNSTAPAGVGVTAAVATALRGDASGAAGTAFTMGVLGTNTATTGSAFGVYGQTQSINAFGIFGVNLDATASAGHGVQGQTGAFGSAAGVRGFNTAAAIAAGQSGYGVRGSSTVAPSGTGFVMGLRGDASGATGNTYGVYGQVTSATGFGMDALNTNIAGTGALIVGNNTGGTFLGIGSGSAVNGTGIGEFAIAKTAASGIGIVAVGNNLTASIITPASGAGISAVGAQYGVMGFATTTVSTTGTSTSAVNGAAASAGGYFEVQSLGVPQTYAYVGVRDNGAVLRKIIGPGTVNTIVNDLQGNRVALSCPEAPENLFQDYGQSQLINGRVHVEIDPIFARNIVVSGQHPLRVFVQLEGNCKGVFVENKNGNGFDVVELDGGASNTAFSYTIVANRADETLPDGSISHYSAERFAAAPGPQVTTRQEAIDVDDAAARNDIDRDQPQAVSSLRQPIKTKPTAQR